MSGERVVRAAGGIVVRDGDHGPEVLVVHRPRYDDWSLPKGKAEGDEDDVACACREVEEETGWRCTVGEQVGDVHYTDRHGRPKRVVWFRMTPVVDTGAFTPNDEIGDRRWVPLAEVDALLTYDADRALVAAERDRHA